MPFSTSLTSLVPRAGHYIFVWTKKPFYNISLNLTDTRTPHVIFFFPLHPAHPIHGHRASEARRAEVGSRAAVARAGGVAELGRWSSVGRSHGRSCWSSRSGRRCRRLELGRQVEGRPTGARAGGAADGGLWSSGGRLRRRWGSLELEREVPRWLEDSATEEREELATSRAPMAEEERSGAQETKYREEAQRGSPEVELDLLASKAWRTEEIEGEGRS